MPCPIWSVFTHRLKKLITAVEGHYPIIREKIIAFESLWLGNEDRDGYIDLREEVILLKGTTCYMCGTVLHPSEVEIDHDTPRKRFKDTTEADRMKHLQPLCTSCHRA